LFTRSGKSKAIKRVAGPFDVRMKSEMSWLLFAVFTKKVFLKEERKSSEKK
jgi:hypothetical protein